MLTRAATAATAADVPLVREIDGTIESARYLHVDRSGNAQPGGPIAVAFRVEDRPAREKVIRPNRLHDDVAFALRQIVSGADNGLALVVGSADGVAALLLAQPDPIHGVLRLLDVRVDYDYRRQGLGTALLFAAVSHAREQKLRAVATETTADNFPAAALLTKCNFELAGVDDRRHSNHDLVKEAVTLFWYAEAE